MTNLHLSYTRLVETKWDEEDLFHSESDRFQVTNLLNPYLLKPLGHAGMYDFIIAAELCKTNIDTETNFTITVHDKGHIDLCMSAVNFCNKLSRDN